MTEIGLHAKLPSGAILYVGKDTEVDDWYTIICLESSGEIHEITLSLNSMDIMVDLVKNLWTTADDGLQPVPDELKTEDAS